jgi:excisionase family DNA binding protein
VGEDQRSGGDQAATDPATGRRLTVAEAAEVLGISGDAVRSRIKRGTLPTVREGGRVLVVMGDTDRPTDQAQPTNRPGEDLLYQEMQARIRYLEQQVEEEREAHRRADTLLTRL